MGCFHSSVTVFVVKYVGTLDLHISLGGLPSHVSQGPIGPIHSFVLPIQGWRPV